MSEDKAGMGANVGVRKIEDDEVTEERGTAQQQPGRLAWAILGLLFALSGFGVWKILELVHFV